MSVCLHKSFASPFNMKLTGMCLDPAFILVSGAQALFIVIIIFTMFLASLASVSVSQSCLNKLPYEWLKTTEIYSPTIREPNVQNQGVGKAGSLERIWGRNYSLSFFLAFGDCQRFLAFFGLQLHSSNLCLNCYITFLSVYLYLLLLCPL